MWGKVYCRELSHRSTQSLQRHDAQAGRGRQGDQLNQTGVSGAEGFPRMGNCAKTRKVPGKLGHFGPLGVGKKCLSSLFPQWQDRDAAGETRAAHGECRQRE